MWLYCSESPILPFEMKWRPVYLRVNYLPMYKFIPSFPEFTQIQLHFHKEKKHSKSSELLQKRVVFHWITRTQLLLKGSKSTFYHHLNTSNTCALVSFTP